MTFMMWQNMTIAERLRLRKDELSGNFKVSIPSEALQSFIQDTSRADSFPAFIASWFLDVTKNLVQSYETFLEAFDSIFDAPTIEIIHENYCEKK